MLFPVVSNAIGGCRCLVEAHQDPHLNLGEAGEVLGEGEAWNDVCAFDRLIRLEDKSHGCVCVVGRIPLLFLVS